MNIGKSLAGSFENLKVFKPISFLTVMLYTETGGGEDWKQAELCVEKVNSKTGEIKTIIEPRSKVVNLLYANVRGHNLVSEEENSSVGMTRIDGKICLNNVGGLALDNDSFLRISGTVPAKYTMTIGGLEADNPQSFCAHYHNVFQAPGEVSKIFGISDYDFGFLPKANLKEIKMYCKDGSTLNYTTDELQRLCEETNGIIWRLWDDNLGTMRSFATGANYGYLLDLESVKRLEIITTTTDTAYTFMMIDLKE